MPPHQLAQTLRSTILHQTSLIPKDPLRPTIQFGTILTKLIDERFALEKPFVDEDVRTLEGVKDGLDKLAANHWRKKYPLTRTTLVPASKPTYYYRIGDAIDRAQRKEAKPWWRTFFGLEASGLDVRIQSGELDERIGLSARKQPSS